MNATMETILHRRSIRSFLDKPIPKPVLEEIVLAGQYAPSAMNRQTWHFTVLQNQEKIQSLAKAIAKELDMGEEYCFYRPAALILVSAPKDNHNGMADCACALENIFLAAWSMEVGSVWINQLKDICDRPAIREML
ncbi:MAG TPA: nitroreductase family protein, partial [Candidatus Egerieicola pullicola]|nr:nitroreductase family protein [Candidatus Egerieicola pullicola]